MKFLLIVSILATVLVWYALQGRAWLKTKPWARGFFILVEPVEIALFSKSETILFARLKVFSGLLLTLLTQIGAIDLSPLLPFVSEKYEAYVRVGFNLLPMIISGVGLLDEKLRNATTLPIEVVAVPEKVIAENPKVAEAVAMAVATKTEAVAAVTEAKAV